MPYTENIQDKNILLHACCGPCSLGAIEPLLADGARITLYYYNPCIIDGEFERRLFALHTVASHYSLSLVAPAHDYSFYRAYAAAHASEREGGKRCVLCFNDRLIGAARYAKEHGFDAFTTTLTVSPHKNSKVIFETGERAATEYGVPFLARDFKKRDGFLRSCRLSEELGIYRQKFCGCEFSYGAADANTAGGDA